MIVIACISTQPVMSLFFGSISPAVAGIISFGAFYYAYAIQHAVSGVYLIGLMVSCIICGIIGTPLYLSKSIFKKEKQPKVRMVEKSEAPKKEGECFAEKIQKTILRIPFRCILFVLAIFETVFQSVFLSEGKARASTTESFFWNHLYEKQEKFYDYEEVYGGTVQNDYPDELWIYVNGILTELEDAKSGCKRMYEMFGRPVKLLHNPTDGPILDLLECLMGKTGLLRHGCSGPRKLLRVKLLEEMKNDYKKIVLVAHSQGTIITGNVIADFSDRIEGVVDGFDMKEREALKKNMSKFEVYIVAGCAHYMTSKYVSSLECISNRGDFVALLGHLFPKILRPIWRNTWNHGIRYDQDCEDHIENSNWGHLLFGHYLDQFEHGLFPNSKLVTKYWMKSPQKMNATLGETETSKLLSK